MYIIPDIASNFFTKDNTFDNYLLIVDAYSKLCRLYGMKSINTDMVMEKKYIFQARFGKVDEFGWWDLEIIQTDSGKKFTSKDFKERISVHGVHPNLAALDHQ